MSSRSWRRELQSALLNVRQPERSPRVAVVGIGHEFRGDDAIGVHVARELSRAPVGPDWLVVEAGPLPENATALLRRFGPDLVVLVDAVRMAEPVGSVRWFEEWTSEATGAATHGLPLDLFAAYVRTELGSTVGLLGMQPGPNQVDDPLSPAARRALHAVVAALRRLMDVPDHRMG